MRTLSSVTVSAILCLAPIAIYGQNAPSIAASVNTSGLSAPDVAVGQNLEAPVKLAINRPLPSEGLQITVKSDNPGMLLLSADPETAGSESIVLKVRPGFAASLEFYAQALAKSGTATYTATSPGFGSASGTATFAPSGIVMAGPLGFGIPGFQTSLTGAKVNLKLFSAMLDASLNFVALQPVAGKVNVEITSSNPAVGGVNASPLVINAGTGTLTTLFKPASIGATTLALKTPANFSVPAKMVSLIAKVALPSFAVSDGLTLGKDLETAATVGLGQPAPPEGLEMTISSSDPNKLLISASATEKGSGSITIKLPGGGMGATVYLQALGEDGKLNYTASAPGYESRSGLIVLAQSGLVIAGPLSFPHSGWRREPGFFSSLKAGVKTQLYVYSAYLDPQTHRTADVTVQPLRAGLSITATITNSEPGVGSAPTQIVVAGGTDTGHGEFMPLSLGQTILSIVTPPGFSTSANSTYLRVTVTP